MIDDIDKLVNNTYSISLASVKSYFFKVLIAIVVTKIQNDNAKQVG